jgi:hypothetical protein
MTKENKEKENLPSLKRKCSDTSADTSHTKKPRISESFQLNYPLVTQDQPVKTSSKPPISNAVSRKKTTLFDLPNEIILKINKYLDPQSAFRFYRQTSKILIDNFETSTILKSHYKNISILPSKIPFLKIKKKLGFSTSLLEAIIIYINNGKDGNFDGNVKLLRKTVYEHIAEQTNLYKSLIPSEDGTAIEEYSDLIKNGNEERCRLEVLLVALMKILNCKILIYGYTFTDFESYKNQINNNSNQLIYLCYEQKKGSSGFYPLKLLPGCNQTKWQKELPLLEDLNYRQTIFFRNGQRFYIEYYTNKYNEVVAQLLYQHKITEESLAILKNKTTWQFRNYLKAITPDLIKKITELSQKANLDPIETTNLFTDKYVIESNLTPFTVIIFYAKRNNLNALKKLLTLKEFSSEINHFHDKKALIHYLIPDIEIIQSIDFEPVMPETLNLLAEHRLRINIMTQTCYTPLYIAATKYSNVDLVNLLLENGAQDPDCYNKKNTEARVAEILRGNEWNYFIEYTKNEIETIAEEIENFNEIFHHLSFFCAHKTDFNHGDDWNNFFNEPHPSFEELITELNTIKSENLIEDSIIFLKIDEITGIIKFLSTYSARILKLEKIKQALTFYSKNNLTQDFDSAYNYERATYLHQICLNSKEESITKAVKDVSDIEIRDENNMTPLILLARS